MIYNKIGGILLALALSVCAGCGGSRAERGDSQRVGEETGGNVPGKVRFNADSAYSYVERQVGFGPRVPNTEAHERAAEWLASELRRHGASVKLQKGDLRAFDGTLLKATNIIGSFNPEADERLLLLAHYDTRPWADEDPDPSKHREPVAGANDGGSGVGVLLELARVFGLENPGKGIDILLTDAEDYGTEGDEESWAMGTAMFVSRWTSEGGKMPSRAILLDMVGGTGAVFPAEYFSRQSAPWLDDAIRSAAAAAGHGDRFPMRSGAAVTDDHVRLIEAGIPAVDIIDYREGGGFAPGWHTASDTMERIDRESLRAVGETLERLVYER